MDVYIGEWKIFSVSEEIIPVFYYNILELGFQVEMNRKDGRLNLLPGLYNKSILLIQDQSLQSSLRREEFENQLLQYIEKGLLSCGVQSARTENKKAEHADLILSVTANQIQFINQPILEIYYYRVDKEPEWIKYIKIECQKRDIKFNIHELDNNKGNRTVKVHLMYPEAMEKSFWENIGADLSLILCVGMICKLQMGNRQTPLSIFPFEAFLKDLTELDKLFDSKLNIKTNQIDGGIESADSLASNIEGEKVESKAELTKSEMDPLEVITEPPGSGVESQSKTPTEQENRFDVEAFFDYHVLLNDSIQKSPKIFGNLTIKNTGLEPLENPIICFRMSPAGSVGFIGQFLQPNTIQTQGIQTAVGPKGWRYMNENWQDEFDEKGEVWIRSVHEIHVEPGEDMQLPNIQMTVKSLKEDKNVKVEAFIFFIEQGLEISASNKISLLLNRG